MATFADPLCNRSHCLSEMHSSLAPRPPQGNRPLLLAGRPGDKAEWTHGPEQADSVTPATKAHASISARSSQLDPEWPKITDITGQYRVNFACNHKRRNSRVVGPFALYADTNQRQPGGDRRDIIIHDR